MALIDYIMAGAVGWLLIGWAVFIFCWLHVGYLPSPPVRVKVILITLTCWPWVLWVFWGYQSPSHLRRNKD